MATYQPIGSPAQPRSSSPHSPSNSGADGMMPSVRIMAETPELDSPELDLSNGSQREMLKNANLKKMQSPQYMQ